MAALQDTLPLERRPIVIAIAGPNGAGKTTFYRAHLSYLELPYVNAGDLAREFEIDAYEAARTAATYRAALVAENRRPLLHRRRQRRALGGPRRAPRDERRTRRPDG